MTLFENGNKKHKINIEFPSVTVIIPAYNEEKSIGKCISSVLDSDYPKNKLKIIVVDDDSDDNTLKIAKNFEKYGVKIISQKRSGKSEAVNHGLKYVDTEFFATLDADSFVERNTLKEMIKYFNDKKVAAVCPVVKVYSPENLIQKLQWFEYLMFTYLKKIYSYINTIHVTPGPFSIYRTEVVKKLGGFDKESLVEDQELAWRLQSKHYKILQAVEGNVYTIAPKNKNL